jgi:hypothetical protein
MVVLTVRGGLDHPAAARLRHVLADLTLGPGNLFVRVEYDVLAEAAVLAAIAAQNPDGGCGALVEEQEPPPPARHQPTTNLPTGRGL